jgi:molecular chaperone DnaK
MSIIGIDFGTTNSVVAVHGPDGAETLPIDSPPGDWATLGFDKVMPTVFGVGPDRSPTFGWSAKQMTDNKIEAVKRLFRAEDSVTIAGEQFLVEEIATLLFSHMKQKAQDSGVDPKKCVVTVPANSRGLARYRTKLTAGMAGMEVLALINEPTAAAMAHSARADDDQRIMVVDWGGGTLDVTILQAAGGVFVEQASKGIQQLGGLDFDSRLARSILESVPDHQSWSSAQNAEFRLAVERAKVLLSSQDFTNVPLPNGDSRRVTREQFEAAAIPLVEKVREPIEQCLRDIGADPNEINSVILVGGTCNIPLVRSFVADITRQHPVEGINPMTAVAEGAAVAAAIMAGELDDNDFFVGTEHALGTIVLDMGTQVEKFQEIIPRNHKLPARSVAPDLTPIFDEQESLLVRVIEGDPELPLEHEDNVVLKEIDVVLPARGTLQEKAVDIAYEYDLDGILHVTVIDRMTGDALVQDMVQFGVGSDKRSLVDMARRVRDTLDNDTVAGGSAPSASSTGGANLSPEATEVLQRARTKVLPFLDGSEALEIKRMIDAVETATPGSDQNAKVRLLEDELVAYSYLF